MKKWFLILGLLVVVGVAMATSRRSFVQPVATATGGFLTDRWYFSNVTETNNAPFRIGFIGAGTRIVEWGDGDSTTTNGTVVIEHVYATAASNIFSIRDVSGTTTRFYFYNLTGRQRLKRILTEPNGVPSMTSLYQTFSGCVNLAGAMPSFAKLYSITLMQEAFNGCTSMTDIPDFSGCTNVTGMYQAFNGCSSLTGPIPSMSGLLSLADMSSAYLDCGNLSGTIPDISGLTNVRTLNLTFANCISLTGSFPSIANLTLITNLQYAFSSTRLTENTSTVAYIFGSGSRSNLLTANRCFQAASGLYASLEGAADDFIKLEKHPNFTTNIYSTNGSYRMFYFQTNLTDYATMPADWK